MFLENAWYVAALAADISRQPFAVKMLNQSLVLFRKQDNTVAVLEDSCPHRRLPLSMGRVQGDSIECGYHGLRFDCSGTCVGAPTATEIPAAAVVRSFPAVERYGLIWVWMGAPEQANADDILQINEWDDAAWGVNSGDAMEMACNYLYITDNLLDPSHVTWVHQSSFGSDDLIGVPLEVTEADNGVTVSRWLRDIEVAPFYKKFVKFEGNCDRKQQYEMRYPGHAVIRAIFTPAGTGDENAVSHPDVFLMDSYNFLTPIDEKNTRYFWFQLRNFSPHDEAVSKVFNHDVRAAFSEDKVVLEAVQKGMDAKGARLSLPSDKGSLLFRRRMSEKIRAEQAVKQK